MVIGEVCSAELVEFCTRFLQLLAVGKLGHDFVGFDNAMVLQPSEGRGEVSASIPWLIGSLSRR